MTFGAVVALAFGLFNVTAAVNGPRQYRPVIAHTVMVETQRHSQVAQETSAAKDVTPVVATAADTKKANITNPKCSPVSATTTAIGTRGVMHKEVSFFSLIRRTGDARRFPPPWTRAMKRGRHATDRAKDNPL